MPQIFYETLEFSFSGDPNTRICGTAKIKCYKDAEKRLFGEDIGDGPNESRECNCLEGCTLIRFDFEIDRAKFDWKATLRSLNYSMEQFSGFEKNIELFQEIFHFYKKNFNSYEKYFRSQNATVQRGNFLQRSLCKSFETIRNTHNFEFLGNVRWTIWPILGMFCFEYRRVHLYRHTSAVFAVSSTEISKCC